MTLKPGRIPCEVMGCRRTAAADKYSAGTKIICGKCWRLASPAARKALRFWKRMAKRAPEKIINRHLKRRGIANGADWRGLDRFVNDRAFRAWDRIIQEAVEAKAGLR